MQPTVTRRSILRAVLFALALGALAGCKERETAPEGKKQAGPAPERAEQQAPEDLQTAIILPSDAIGEPVAGQAIVSEVVSARGFWLTNGRNYLFTVVRQEASAADRLDIASGQKLRLRGTLLAAGDPFDARGKLDARTRELAQKHNKLVVSSWRDIQIVSRPSKRPVGGGPGKD